MALSGSSILMAQNTSPYWSLSGNNNATTSSKLGTTNLVPLKFFTSNKQRMIIDSLGRVGINTNNPVNILTVKSSGGIPAASWLNGLNKPVFIGFAEAMSSEHVLSAASNVAIERAVFQGRRSRGTLAAPTAVANNDYITSLLASAYDGSNFQNPALVSFFVDGTPSAGNVPTRISFVTGSNAGNRTERLKVGSTGNFDFNNGQVYLQQSNRNVGIGTTSPGSRLQVVAGYDGDGISVVGSAFGPKDAAFTLTDDAGHAGSLGLASANNAFMSGVVSGDIILSNNSGKIHFGTGAASGFPAMTVAGGSVGIGTTAPAPYRLEVQGGDNTAIYSFSINGHGVYGYSSNYHAVTGASATSIGVYGIAYNANAYAGYFEGSVYTTGTYQGSDRKLKQNITDFSSALNIISKLHPKSYEYRQDGTYKLCTCPRESITA